MTDQNKDYLARMCRACGKLFRTPQDRMRHEGDKHSPKGLRRAAALKVHQARQLAEDAEPSMADLVIDASLARSMGEPVDNDIEDMFGDYLWLDR